MKKYLLAGLLMISVAYKAIDILEQFQTTKEEVGHLLLRTKNRGKFSPTRQMVGIARNLPSSASAKPPIYWFVFFVAENAVVRFVCCRSRI
ncbi:MAG TPA: hypothetical protein VEZ55_00160 [Chitinophagaceae bacterium]|jgi:hypothetical protein|nr:hypothetical protein [Chitinophagaceae bacterium]